MSIYEAAKEALEALENVRQYDKENLYGLDDDITALRAALAEPTCQESRQVEPVAWAVITKSGKLYKAASTKKSAERKAQQQIYKLGPEWECSVSPLYRAPPKRKPLTDEEIESCIDEDFDYGLDRGNISNKPVIRFARAIERAHGIGGDEAIAKAAAERKPFTEAELEPIRRRMMYEAYSAADDGDSERYNALKVMANDVLDMLLGVKNEPR